MSYDDLFTSWLRNEIGVTAVAIPPPVDDSEVMTSAVHQHDSYGMTDYSRWLGRCPSCKATVKREVLASEPINGLWFLDARLTLVCPTCSIPVKAKMVVGRRSERHCDARCSNAKGPDCECSCGGENHGKDS